MKRTRIAVLSCTAVLCFALLVGAIWAAVVATFGINTKLTFNPNGVYVELSGQIYRGASYSELEPLLDDPTYTLETCKNYTTDETGTPTAYSTPQWAANEVLFLPTEKVIQFKLNVTNKGDKQISVVPTNDVTITGVTVSEEASDTLAIPAGETREYRITLTAGTTELKSVPFELNLDIVNTEDITNPESDFAMTDGNADLLSSYNNPVYGQRIVVMPEKIGGTEITKISGTGLRSNTNVKYIIFASGLKELNYKNCVGMTNLVGVSIPNGLEKMTEPFAYCNKLTNIYLPASLTNMSGTYPGDGPFPGCSSLRITVDEMNPKFSSLNGSLCNKDITILYRGVNDRFVKMPETIVTIWEGAYRECDFIEEIALPNQLTTIGESAFSGCSSLKSITIPYNVNSFTSGLYDENSYGENSGQFQYCTSLTTVIFNCKANQMRSRMFYGCSSLVEVILSEGLRFINDQCFYNCTALETIKLPSVVGAIGSSAFSGCSSLAVIMIDSQDFLNQVASTGAGYTGFISYATTIYIKSGLSTTSATYLTGNFTKQSSSDKTGYDKWVKNS